MFEHFETCSKQGLSNQQIFDLLADLEEQLFYIDITYQGKDTAAAHELSKRILEAFASATGCHN